MPRSAMRASACWVNVICMIVIVLAFWFVSTRPTHDLNKAGPIACK